MSSDITKEEARAIRNLERLAKRWPPSLKLFGNSGALAVIHTTDDMPFRALAWIDGIHGDGGDADWLDGGEPE